MKSFLLLFLSLIVISTAARSAILEGYDSIEEFRLTDGGWLLSVVGTESTLLENPTSVVASHNLVYIIDDGLRSLYVFDLVTRKATTLSGAYEKIEGNISRLYINNDQSFFIMDKFGSQVHKYGLKGEYLMSYQDSLNLNSPVGMCTNPENGHVFVADGFYSHVIEFSESGESLALHGLRKRGQTQAGNGIIGMACNKTELFIVSKFGKYINVLSFSGDLIRQIPRPEVHNPTSIAVDQYNRVYISDAFDDQIKIYDQSKMIAEFGSAGMDLLSFRGIKGLWVDGSFLYVADSMNRRVQVLMIKQPDQYNLHYEP
ncbi:MAG: hypothetical protein ISEC1_P1706 [Thiomicrorhabdus sp.]|nr:MAG: hypothetical protein ISEC1_P1706 [Thiomicrorhabdus sp.]